MLEKLFLYDFLHVSYFICCGRNSKPTHTVNLSVCLPIYLSVCLSVVCRFVVTLGHVIECEWLNFLWIYFYGLPTIIQYIKMAFKFPVLSHRLSYYNYFLNAIKRTERTPPD